MKKFCALLLLWPVVAHALNGVGLGEPAAYPEGFRHFAYVNPAAPKGGALTLPMPGGFDTLNPFALKGDREAGVAMLTLDQLMVKSYDEPFAMYGLLAEDMRLASDGLSVTFKINPKARFHNGDHVLAKDVAFSFNTLTRDKAAVPIYKFYWADVASVETPALRTVVFRFKRRNAELHMILGELPVFSHKSYPKGLAAAPNTVPIGSGPYRLARTDAGRMSEFRRDADYWAKDLPTRKGMFNFDTVRLRYYRDDSVRIEGIKGGRYDFVQETVARNWARTYPENLLAKRHLQKYEWIHNNTAGMQGFVMNQRRKPFDNLLVRQALVESFDFESINTRLFYGLYQRSNSLFTNSVMAADGRPQGRELALLDEIRGKLPATVFEEDVPQPPVADPVLGVRPNLLKARALLNKAGYRYLNGVLVDDAGNPLVIEFLTPSKTYERITAKWQRDLAKIGIRLNVRVVDSAVYQKRLDDFDYDMTIVVYSNSESPGNEQFNYFSCEAAKTPGSRNWAGVCDPAIEALLPKFTGFTSREELTAAAKALDRVIRHQYILVPNWYSRQHRVIYRNNLHIPENLPKYYSAMSLMLETGWVR
ncbi:peptide ABC transporter substrate-binding protein [Neisseria arctica]|uniref:Peptide ABC transporter substrate-binding protein n=1 Tax=Neisseria arctica TaxID=1470200 RepID=A0A0J0YSA1_9NEIS|nr:extracellular solute-binding protein [Neisseria arctica]KLT72977.1 peptide ABC transporter substrate-binding protein [Neisseria arctica]UOO86479.1 extracellular solute-binding protein [Neisseria arctica]